MVKRRSKEGQTGTLILARFKDMLSRLIIFVNVRGPRKNTKYFFGAVVRIEGLWSGLKKSGKGLPRPVNLTKTCNQVN